MRLNVGLRYTTCLEMNDTFSYAVAGTYSRTGVKNARTAVRREHLKYRVSRETGE